MRAFLAFILVTVQTVSSQKCQPGYYDSSLDDTCHPCSSTCITCTSASNCLDCRTGYHGTDCRSVCPENCEHGDCRKEDGHCTCSNGYYLQEYTDDGQNKYGCLPCSDHCLSCAAASSCTSCEPGYFGIRCDSECHAHCQNETCRKVDGYCACATGYFIYRYNNGNYICSKCPEHCSSCTSSASCSECKPGFHGVTCQLPCTANCENGFCQKPDGFCNCRKGTYVLHGNDGFQCLECPYACDTCTSVASCNSCKPAYFGPSCDRECPNCINDKCIFNTGVCASGCKIGYYQGRQLCHACPSNCKRCSSPRKCEECIPGYYGTACQKQCGNCLRVPDKTSICWYNGNCVHGCDSGFVGEKCTISASDTSTAVIVGSTLGTVAFCVILGCIVFIVCRKSPRQTNQSSRHDNPSYEMTNASTISPPQPPSSRPTSRPLSRNSNNSAFKGSDICDKSFDGQVSGYKYGNTCKTQDWKELGTCKEDRDSVYACISLDTM